MKRRTAFLLAALLACALPLGACSAVNGALEGLGGCPAQEEEQRLAYAQTQLETALDAARAEAAQQRRLYRTLGLSLGGADALLLL